MSIDEVKAIKFKKLPRKYNKDEIPLMTLFCLYNSARERISILFESLLKSIISAYELSLPTKNIFFLLVYSIKHIS